MEQAEIIRILIEGIFALAFLTLIGFFIYWTAKFLNTTPEYLKRIAVALEKIANKK